MPRRICRAGRDRGGGQQGVAVGLGGVLLVGRALTSLVGGLSALLGARRGLLIAAALTATEEDDTRAARRPGTAGLLLYQWPDPRLCRTPLVPLAQPARRGASMLSGQASSSG